MMYTSPGTPPEVNPPIRILIVDDQPMVRRGLVMRLSLEPDLEVVGEAESGQQALVAALDLRPQVVIMDVAMPGMDGIEAAAALRRLLPEARVIMLSIYDNRLLREQAQAAGAAAFVEKRNGVTLLLEAIRAGRAEKKHPR